MSVHVYCGWSNASEVTLRNLTCLAHVFEERYRARGGTDSPGLRTTGLYCVCLEILEMAIVFHSAFPSTSTWHNSDVCNWNVLYGVSMLFKVLISREGIILGVFGLELFHLVWLPKCLASVLWLPKWVLETTDECFQCDLNSTWITTCEITIQVALV